MPIFPFPVANPLVKSAFDQVEFALCCAALLEHPPLEISGRSFRYRAHRRLSVGISITLTWGGEYTETKTDTAAKVRSQTVIFVRLCQNEDLVIGVECLVEPDRHIWLLRHAGEVEEISYLEALKIIDDTSQGWRLSHP